MSYIDFRKIGVFLIGVILLSVLCIMGMDVYNTLYPVTEKSTQLQQYERVVKIYNNLVAHTGRSGDIPSIEVIDNESINAYATKDRLVIYTGMIDYVHNDDELALVIGHEIAHVLLNHLDMQTNTDAEVSILESMADKMGAYYIMAAGYDICAGREFWNRLKHEEGDYINKDHPDMAYRYDQLNVQCGGGL